MFMTNWQTLAEVVGMQSQGQLAASVRREDMRHLDQSICNLSSSISQQTTAANSCMPCVQQKSGVGL